MQKYSKNDVERAGHVYNSSTCATNFIPYVPNIGPLVVSNNFWNADRDYPKISDFTNKLQETDANSIRENRNQPQHDAWNNKVPGPNGPAISHALVTKAQEAMKVSVIEISPPKITINLGLPAVVF